MCRMLVAVGEFNVSKLFDAAIAMALDTTNDHEYHKRFGGKGNFKHQDGWGISYLDSLGAWQVFKSTTAIFEDNMVESFRSLRTSYLMIHVRYAKGSEKALENTHPFQMNRLDVGDFVFCHNGYVPSQISHCPSFTPIGKTDSEQLFYSILSYNKEHDLRDSVKLAMNAIKTPYGTNVILSSKDKSYIMVGKNSSPKYYGMHIGSHDTALIVSSEVLTKHEEFAWMKAPVEVPITVDHRKLIFESSLLMSASQNTLLARAETVQIQG